MTTSKFTMTRRAALLGAGGALLMPRPVWAQAYPGKAVTFVCAFPAGSGADVVVRYMADQFNKITGQTVIVENRPGAQANIAAEFTRRSPPDGLTLLVHAGNAIAGNVWLLKNPPLDPAKDLRTLATMYEQSFLFTVAADSPYQTMDDLVADQKIKGENGSYAFNTTSAIVLAEEFLGVTGLKTEQIRYGSAGESLNDILAGHVDFAVQDPGFSLAQVNAGRLRILGVASAERMPGMPDVPTLVEQGYNVVQSGWWGVMGPAEIPDALANEINAVFVKITDQEATRQYFAEQGGIAISTTADEAQQLMVDTIAEWKRLVEIAQIEPQ